MRERILIMGGPGAGKTYQWIKLAQFNPEKRFYVIDSEIGAARSLQEFPEVSNVTVYPVTEWAEYREAQRNISTKAKEGDWAVIDMADKAWTAVQRYFVGSIFEGQEMGEYFLEARARAKKDAKSLFGGRDAALKGWLDWPVINRLYDDFINPLVYRSPANLYIVTAGQAVSEDDETEVRELYGPYRLKPAGQKNLGHQPDTVLIFSRDKSGYYMSTVKDRGGRKYFDREKLANFPVQYGQAAGWL